MGFSEVGHGAAGVLPRLPASSLMFTFAHYCLQKPPMRLRLPLLPGSRGILNGPSKMCTCHRPVLRWPPSYWSTIPRPSQALSPPPLAASLTSSSLSTTRPGQQSTPRSALQSFARAEPVPLLGTLLSRIPAWLPLHPVQASTSLSLYWRGRGLPTLPGKFPAAISSPTRVSLHPPGLHCLSSECPSQTDIMC